MTVAEFYAAQAVRETCARLSGWALWQFKAEMERTRCANERIKACLRWKGASSK